MNELKTVEQLKAKELELLEGVPEEVRARIYAIAADASGEIYSYHCMHLLKREFAYDTSHLGSINPSEYVADAWKESLITFQTQAAECAKCELKEKNNRLEIEAIATKNATDACIRHFDSELEECEARIRELQEENKKLKARYER